MDFATILGLAVALIGIIGGMALEGGRISQVFQPAAALIVLGGTAGAVLVSYPLGVVGEAVKVVFSLLFSKAPNPDPVYDEIMSYANRARKDGFLSLERHTHRASDPFLREALSLVVDGNDSKTIRSMLELKLQNLEERLERVPKVFEAAGGYAPTLGILGAVLGLMQVMQHLDNVQEVGQGIATAFVATLYGVGSANLLFLPVGTKLRDRQRDEIVLKEMMLEGALAIRDGLSPYLLADKLRSFKRDESSEAA